MAMATPIGVPPVDPTRVLQCAGDLLRHHARWEVNKILELEHAVYSCWRFQIDVPTAMYRANDLDRIAVNAENVLMSRRLPAHSQISPMAVLSRKNLYRDGPGQLLTSRSGPPYTEYSFDWLPNGDAHSVVVGDLARTVLCWRLNNPPINYCQHTRTVPDAQSWRLWRTIERWQQNYDALVPTEISLHPGAALDYVRNLPDFTDALHALAAFDSHVPRAVSPEEGEWTLANEREHADTRPIVRPDLSVLPLSVLPTRETPDQPDTKGTANATITREQVSLDTLLAESNAQTESETVDALLAESEAEDVHHPK